MVGKVVLRTKTLLKWMTFHRIIKKNEIQGCVFEAHCIRQCEYPLLRVIQRVDRLKGEK